MCRHAWEQQPLTTALMKREVCGMRKCTKCEEVQITKRYFKWRLWLGYWRVSIPGNKSANVA